MGVSPFPICSAQLSSCTESLPLNPKPFLSLDKHLRSRCKIQAPSGMIQGTFIQAGCEPQPCPAILNQDIYYLLDSADSPKNQGGPGKICLVLIPDKAGSVWNPNPKPKGRREAWTRGWSIPRSKTNPAPPPGAAAVSLDLNSGVFPLPSITSTSTQRRTGRAAELREAGIPQNLGTLGWFLLLDQGFPSQALLRELFPSSPLVFPDSRERFQRRGKAGAGRSYLYLIHITAPRL